MLSGRLLSYLKKRKINRNGHSLSFVVTRCHSLYHSLSLVVIRCPTRLSFSKRSDWNVKYKIFLLINYSWKKILFYNISSAIHGNNISEILILFEYFRNMCPCHRRFTASKNIILVFWYFKRISVWWLTKMF